MKNFIKKKSLFGFILLLLAIGVTNAQMGIGTDDPDPSALLDIKASDKGLLIPRVTIENLSNALPITTAPEESLLVYNETASTDPAIKKGYYYWTITTAAVLNGVNAAAAVGEWIPIANPEGIGQNLTSTDGSIFSTTTTTDANGTTTTTTNDSNLQSGVSAVLKELNLQVNVDNATIKINTGLPENPQPSDIVNTAEKGKLYVDAAYSTDEKTTIRKWLDGEDIYEIVKTVTTAASSTKLVITGGISGLTQVLNIRIIADAVTGGANANAGGVHHSGKYTTTEGNAVITVGSGKMSSKLPAGTYFIIVEYLKTIPTTPASG